VLTLKNIKFVSSSPITYLSLIIFNSITANHNDIEICFCISHLLSKMNNPKFNEIELVSSPYIILCEICSLSFLITSAVFFDGPFKL